MDAAELDKPTVKPDLAIHCDASLFLEEMNRQAVGFNRARHASWLGWCRQRVMRYPVVTERHRTSKGRINPYHFLDVLFHRLHSDDVVVCGDGSACVITFQAAWLQDGQRLWCNSGCASMGYDLPAAMGAAVARGGKRIICLAGDGSIQMNIQELQTVAHHQLPIKIFVLNNDGYLSIRQSQQAFFKRQIGEGPKSGVSFPDLSRVARAYGLQGVRIERGDLAAAVDYVLGTDGPFLARGGARPRAGLRAQAVRQAVARRRHCLTAAGRHGTIPSSGRAAHQSPRTRGGLTVTLSSPIYPHRSRDEYTRMPDGADPL